VDVCQVIVYFFEGFDYCGWRPEQREGRPVIRRQQRQQASLERGEKRTALLYRKETS
jgi:hypothetical protein